MNKTPNKLPPPIIKPWRIPILMLNSQCTDKSGMGFYGVRRGGLIQRRSRLNKLLKREQILSRWCETMNIEQQLTDLGWEKHRNILGCSYFKQTEGLPKCSCNDKSPHIEIKILTEFGQTSIVIRAQTKDGQWMRLESYSIPVDELLTVLDRECERLKKAWIAASGEQA